MRRAYFAGAFLLILSAGCVGWWRLRRHPSTVAWKAREPRMSESVRVSVAGPGEGVTKPEDVEVVHVSDETDEYMGVRDESSLVILWHGNGYDRESCWFQVPEDAACDLSSYL